MYPDNLRYNKEHEWIGVKESEATVGVSFFAQSELGDVVFVELPEVGQVLKVGEEFGTVESVKAVSELYSPVSGEVLETNKDLEDHPEFINEDPYGRGWMMKVRLSDPGELELLMDVTAYKSQIGKSGD
jgi:glycine cleavage system H protein